MVPLNVQYKIVVLALPYLPLNSHSLEEKHLQVLYLCVLVFAFPFLNGMLTQLLLDISVFDYLIETSDYCIMEFSFFYLYKLYTHTHKHTLTGILTHTYTLFPRPCSYITILLDKYSVSIIMTM